MRSSCIICTFLCAAFSLSIGLCHASTQFPDSSAFHLREALRCEEVVYRSEDPFLQHDALLKKARHYDLAGRREEALSTLGRIRLYMLDQSQISEILSMKSVLAEKLGDYPAALAFLEESPAPDSDPARYAVLLARAGRMEQSRIYATKAMTYFPGRLEEIETLFSEAPTPRNEKTALALSFIPPAGQLYLGLPCEGLKSFFLNAGAAAFTIWQVTGGNWITGLLGGGIALERTYFKDNLARNAAAVGRVNEEANTAFAKKLSDLLYRK